MDSELIVAQYKDKIKQLLDKCLQPDFEIKTDGSLNIFLSNLSGKENEDFGNALTNLHIITDWLFTATKLWEENGTLPTESVTTFTLKLASYLSKTESHFLDLNTCGVYLRISLLLKLNITGKLSSVKIAYVNLLSSFLQHKPGIEWLIATNNWQDILTYCLQYQDSNEIQDGYNFMSRLLEQSYSYNKIFCRVIIEKIMAILSDFHFLDKNCDVNYELLEKTLTPSLQLVCHILESCLDSKVFAKNDYTIPKIFLGNYKLEEILTNVLKLNSQNENFLKQLTRIRMLHYIIKLIISVDSQRIDLKLMQTTAYDLFSLVSGPVNRTAIFTVLDLSCILNYYWSIVDTYIPHTMYYRVGKNELVFENQILILQVTPIVFLSYSVCGLTAEQLDTEEDIFRSNFISKVFKSMCECTVRIMHSFRNALVTKGKTATFTNAYKALQCLMDSRKSTNVHTAAMLFQVLIYVIKDVIDSMNNKPKTKSIFSKEAKYFIYHFDAIETLVQEFDITWRESVETINLMGLSMEFMGFPIWPAKLVVRAMNLIDVSIKRFMPSNLALLIDVTSDSTLAYLGPIVSTKLKDDNAELRISAINILCTIANVAHTKFPSFQKMVLEYNWPSQMVSVCVNDAESSVKTAAIICLQEMIKVYDFWNNILKTQDLSEKMIKMIYNESDAKVRAEAVTLLCQIYEHWLITHHAEDTIDRALMFAATSDDCWNVKTRALQYYEVLININLTNQGMIDGTFPTVTFSKEERKIVTLTDKQIKSRLVRVLTELHKYDCLSVLISAIEDDSNLELSKKATDIAKKLGDFLILYEITPDSLCSTPTPSTENHDPFSVTAEFRKTTSCGEITKRQHNDFRTRKAIKTVIPEEFVSFVHQDLYNFMEKKMWAFKTKQFETALDSMLETKAVETVDCMDCQ